MTALPASILRRATALGMVAALLAGCAGAVPLPAENVAVGAPRMLHVAQESAAGQAAVDRILVVQDEGGATRWSLFDPLGTPVTRQVLRDGAWRNDGFVRPDDQARALFAALLFAWTPEDELVRRYGRDATRLRDDGARVLAVGGAPRVTVEREDAQGLRVTVADRGTWHVRPLETQP